MRKLIERAIDDPCHANFTNFILQHSDAVKQATPGEVEGEVVEEG